MKHSSDFGPHVGDDRLLDLVQGLLPSDVRRVTLDHLQRCGTCEPRFQDLAASHARAQSEAPARLGERVVRLERPIGGERRFMSRRWLWAGGAVAAAVAFAWFAAQHGVVAPVVPELESALPAARLRGAIRTLQSTAADSAIMAGLEAYNRNDFDAARRILESTRGSASMELVRRIYLGSVLLQLGDADRARSVLSDLPEWQIPEPWKSEARWTLAMALQGSGHAHAADSLLQVLAAEEGPVADRAKAYRLGAARGR